MELPSIIASLLSHWVCCDRCFPWAGFLWLSSFGALEHRVCDGALAATDAIGDRELDCPPALIRFDRPIRRRHRLGVAQFPCRAREDAQLDRHRIPDRIAVDAEASRPAVQHEPVKRVTLEVTPGFRRAQPYSFGRDVPPVPGG